MATSKKAVTKKAPGKAPGKKSAAKKAPAKAPAKKSAAKKGPARKSAAKKAPAKKAPAKSASGKKSSAKKAVGRRYSPAASANVEREMRAMKEGRLTIGKSKKKVTNPKQAIAIALSESRREGDELPPDPNAKS